MDLKVVSRYYLIVLVNVFFRLCANDVLTVDFDESLGKNHNLYGRYYHDCFEQENPTMSTYWGILTKTKNPVSLYVFLKDLYEKNKPSNVVPSNNRIPYHIHQVWIQGSLPEKYRNWQKTWQEILPGWTYTLWTDKEIRAMGLRNQSRYDQAKNLGEKSDIARYEILYNFGGVYLDTDFECLQPEAFKNLNDRYTFYAGIQPLNTLTFTIAMGMIGSVPGHPILKGMIDYIFSQKHDESLPVYMKTGPIPFTNIFWQYADRENYIDIALPPTYFYPAGMGISHNDYSKYLRPESIALHYWEASWNDKKKNKNKS